MIASASIWPAATVRRLAGCFLATVLVSSLGAAEISGTISALNGGIVTVAPQGDLAPNVGDKAKVFFKLPGFEDEIAVATGQVSEVEGDSIQIKIENATGQIARDHLVRITSDKPRPRAVRIPSALATAPPGSVAEPPPRRGKLLWEDGFDRKEGVQIEGNRNVNGEREMIANPGGTRSQPYFDVPRDFFAQCTVRSTASVQDCLVGFYFHGIEKENVTVTYDSIAFTPEKIGFVSLRDREATHSEWVALPAGIHKDPAQADVLGVEVIGGAVRVFVNDNCVANLTDASPSEGRRFLLVLRSEGETPCASYFDHLKIYDLSAPAEKTEKRSPKSRVRNR